MTLYISRKSLVKICFLTEKYPKIFNVEIDSQAATTTKCRINVMAMLPAEICTHTNIKSVYFIEINTSYIQFLAIPSNGWQSSAWQKF